MRGGMKPKDAGMAALKRVVANTIEKRLLNHRGKPNFQVTYYILSPTGEHAGVTMYELSGKEPVKYSVCTEDGPQTLRAEAMFPGTAED